MYITLHSILLVISVKTEGIISKRRYPIQDGITFVFGSCGQRQFRLALDIDILFIHLIMLIYLPLGSTFEYSGA